jgi:lysophospholipase L1-like esterase
MKHPTILALLLLALTFATPSLNQAAEPAHNFAQWDKEIAAFAEADKVSPPPKGALLFTGSSTIRKWTTLAQDFPKEQVINRGFGGSEILDVTHFAGQIIFPYAPRMILLRSGGNDLHNGKSPAQVFADFKELVATVHAKLPETIVVFISNSPSVLRKSEAGVTQELNALVEAWIKKTPGTAYLEASTLSLGPDGQPRPDLFVEDKLHFNAEGYRLLADRVRAFLAKQAP